MQQDSQFSRVTASFAPKHPILTRELSCRLLLFCYCLLVHRATYPRSEMEIFKQMNKGEATQKKKKMVNIRRTASSIMVLFSSRLLSLVLQMDETHLDTHRHTHTKYTTAVDLHPQSVAKTTSFLILLCAGIQSSSEWSKQLKEVVCHWRGRASTW